MRCSRKLLKINAKTALKQNYWNYIAVSFLVMLICGTSYTSTILFQQNDWSENTNGLLQMLHSGISAHTMRESLGIVWEWIAVKNVWRDFRQGILPVLLWIVYKIFISNIVLVNSLRFYLESRTYPKTPVKKMRYLYKAKTVKNPAKIMMVMYGLRLLWGLTIIGGIIKSYEYAMIPYILAENPDIEMKDAFRLSKRMMQGEKMELFLFHLSFAGWFLLGVLTMTLSNIFFSNAYFVASETEFYMGIRRNIIGERNNLSRLFSDKYLENKPSEDEILINMFVLEKDYMPNLEADEFSQNIYPMFLREKDSKWYEPPYQIAETRKYHITTYILLFFFTSIVGWVLHAAVRMVQMGKFLLDGLTCGPWLPIVGVTSIMILIVGAKLRKYPFLNIVFITIFSSVVQYFYVWVLEMKFGKLKWDFSDYFMNLHGRICLASVVTIGSMGIAFFYLVAPEVDTFLQQYPLRKKWKISILLIALFVLDVGYNLFCYLI